MEYLAATPSRMLAVTLEDVLGWIDQVNVPGTIDEHPNWRRRTGVPLEDFSRQPTLTAVAEIMAKAGRSIASA
jgi:4-alpha-glucanotransferase